MFVRGRIACHCLASALLFARGAHAQQMPPLPWPPPSPVAIPDQDLPPFTNTAEMRLTVDGYRRYVLGTDPVWIRVSLTTGDQIELLWRANAPQRVLTGFTYKITGPDGQTSLVKTCRAGSDTWNTTVEVEPEMPFEEEIDLAALNCSDFKLTKPGHYSVQVDFKRPVCPGLSPHDCLITDEYGEFSMLTISSNRFEFDVLAPYTAGNPGPSEATPPETADSQIEALLKSDNSRMVAWAAYFILRDHPAGGVSKLQSWLESAIANNYLPPAAWDRNWRPGEKDSELDKERSRAAHAVLDALIQSHVALSDAQIQKVAVNEPVLALIFAMRPDWNEATVLKIFDLLGGLKWDGQTGNADPDYSARFSVRDFAAEALAISGSRKFLDRLRAEFILKLDFEVMPAERKDAYFQTFPNFMWPMSCGAARGGYISRGDMVPGWPPIGNYGLSEGIPGQVLAAEAPFRRESFDPADAVSLGRGNLNYTRIVSQRYGAAAFAISSCGESFRWIALYGHHNERFETRTVFFVTGDDDYHDQLTKWVGGLGATYAQILSDADAAPTPLRVTLHGIDYLHPAPGSNVSDAYKFDFPGFPPKGVAVIPQ
jgi:hypothetical protein